MLIIDCHGHYTTAPAAHQMFRDQQIEHIKNPALPPPAAATVSDDEIRETIETHQLKLQRQRGADITIFSPRASAMAHHIGDESVSQTWTRACNNLIKRVTDLYPDNFVGVCQLPQSPGVPIARSIAELTRCVTELGFIGCNLNPDPSGGHWTAPPLTDRHWYPFYEKMVELDAPAMIHVSGSCNPNFHATGAHYINADTTAFISNRFSSCARIRSTDHSSANKSASTRASFSLNCGVSIRRTPSMCVSRAILLAFSRLRLLKYKNALAVRSFSSRYFA